MSKPVKYILIVILFMMLACVRAFENSLFYDPLLNYYRTDFTDLPLPDFDRTLLTVNLFLRYFINSVISLAIIQLWFMKAEITRFAAIMLAVLFLLLIAAFMVSESFFPDHKMMLFYIRRFLIHPIFLILFIPAFFFQEKVVYNKRD